MMGSQGRMAALQSLSDRTRDMDQEDMMSEMKPRPRSLQQPNQFVVGVDDPNTDEVELTAPEYDPDAEQDPLIKDYLDKLRGGWKMNSGMNQPY